MSSRWPRRSHGFDLPWDRSSHNKKMTSAPGWPSLNCVPRKRSRESKCCRWYWTPPPPLSIQYWLVYINMVACTTLAICLRGGRCPLLIAVYREHKRKTWLLTERWAIDQRTVGHMTFKSHFAFNARHRRLVIDWEFMRRVLMSVGFSKGPTTRCRNCKINATTTNTVWGHTLWRCQNAKVNRWFL